MRRFGPLCLGCFMLACSGQVEPSSPDPGPPTREPTAMDEPEPEPTPLPERRATLRIDAQPGGKKFQGVWLEFADGSRWVVDYRPREPWQSFADRIVLVEGHCYQPFGQAISATHFEVERLRFETPQPGSTPLLGVGPRETMKGRFEAVGHPPGSKLAGTTDLHFRSEAGASFSIFGAIESRHPTGEVVTVVARRVEIDPTYAATTGGDRIWIERVEAADYSPEPAHADQPRDCP